MMGNGVEGRGRRKEGNSIDRIVPAETSRDDDERGGGGGEGPRREREDTGGQKDIVDKAR